MLNHHDMKLQVLSQPQLGLVGYDHSCVCFKLQNTDAEGVFG